MTVKDLIEALREFPDNAEVLYDDGEEEFPIDEVEEEDGAIFLSTGEDDGDDEGEDNVIDIEARHVA